MSAAGTPFGARLGLARSAPRSAPTVAGPQCAGTAIAIGGTAADSARHRVEGLHEHSLAAVRGAVGGHQRNRVADPLDETAQHEAGLVQVRVLARHADFGGAIVEQA